MKISKTIKKNLSPLTITLFVVLSAYVLFMLAIFFWAFLTASKAYYGDYYSLMGENNVIGWPKKFMFFKNIAEINNGFADYTLLEMALYTVLYSVGCSVFKVIVTCVVAYLCARYDNWFSRLVYSVVIVTMIIPIVGSQAAEIQMAKDLRLYNHIWGMWLMRSNFLGMYYLVFYSVFKSMPAGYYEAARIDGANDWQIMCNIAMPLVKNTFLSITLILFIEYWNDYLIPNLYLPDFKTLSLALYQQSQGQEVADTAFKELPYVMTTVVIVTIPVIAIFAVFSKQLMGNLSVGGIKG
ncbi:MAG: carbohydrate ABC transporter permease [Clostridia bacterium]|nr:carbohydrate ABC transporter permease [Clostridia bacterium]